MKIFGYGKDGGYKSTVWGYWLVEIKSLFSIVLLRFENGSRDAYHEHAFNCFSWVLKGKLYEEFVLDGKVFPHCRAARTHQASRLPFITRRTDFHRVTSTGRTWVLSFRGPWGGTWRESVGGTTHTLTHGRRMVE